MLFIIISKMDGEKLFPVRPAEQNRNSVKVAQASGLGVRRTLEGLGILGQLSQLSAEGGGIRCN